MLRDGPVLVVCEVKTRSATASAPRSRRSTERRPTRLRRLADRWREDHGVRPAEVRIDLVGVLQPTARGARGRARAGGRLMPLATARTVSLRGRDRAPDRRAGRRRRTGLVATALVGRPDVSISEARDRCRAAVHQQPLRVAGHPAGDDPAVAGRPAQARPALRPGDRGRRCSPAAGEGPAGTRSTSVVLIGELTLDGRLRAVPGVLPMMMAAQAAGMRSVVVPEPQADEAAMVPGMTVFGVRSLPQVVALLTGARRCPRRRRWSRSPAAVAALLARRGADRRPRPRRRASAWPTPASRSRSRPPAATT